MAWADSRVFQEWDKNPLFNGSGGTPPTGYSGFLTNVMKCALFGSTASMTPDRNATLATTGYNSATSQWVVANEKTGSSEWVAGGRALASKTNVASAGTITLDAADLVGAASITMSSVAGCLIYDDDITAGTIADQGMCYLFFSGDQAVTAGTFTVSFNAAGIVTATV
jgi:hypothetical protein